MSNLKVLICVSDFRYINPGVPKSEGEYSSADTNGTSLVPVSRYQCVLWTNDRKGKLNVTKPFSSASSRGTSQAVESTCFTPTPSHRPFPDPTSS